MALSAVTAAVALFYLSAIPLHLAFCLSVGGGHRLGAGLSALGPRRALHRAQTHPLDFNQKIALPKSIDRKALLRALKFAAEHLHIESALIDGSVGTDDAALTALICGGARALSTSLSCASRRNIRFSLRPDFSVQSLCVKVDGMICVRVGHIMVAALRAAFQYALRRTKHGQASH